MAVTHAYALLTWRHDTVRADFADNPGAVFFDTKNPAILPGFVDEQCQGGALVLTGHGDLEPDFMSRALLRMIGPENYHPVEYQLYYASIRENSGLRVGSFVGGGE